jgi:hypothetical protein
MKYLLESSIFNEIDQICQQYGIWDYTPNPDGSINVDGDVDLIGRDYQNYPLSSV